MKLKVGDEVRTPMGRGFIRKIAHDVKFKQDFYFVDVIKSDNLARLTKSKYDTCKFWDYEVKEVTK
jgi:hypothetical protein